MKIQKLKVKSQNFIVLFILLFIFFPKQIHAQVVINEFVVDGSPEWVEFYNASSSAEFLKSYWLDDDTDFTTDTGSSTKKVLTDLVTTNTTYPFIEMNSFLNNSANSAGEWDHVVLFDSSGAIVDQYQYTSNPGDGISIGRSPDRTGGFSILQTATKGSTNSIPQTPSPTPSPTPEPPALAGWFSRVPILPIIFIVLGVGFLGGTAVMFLKSKQTEEASLGNEDKIE